MAFGIVALLMGIVDYLDTLRWTYPGKRVPIRRTPLAMAVAMFLLGLLLAYGIVARVL